MPEELGYKHGNTEPSIQHHNQPENYKCQVRIMDDPDAMEAVGKVWVHDLRYINASVEEVVEGKNDFGELGYGGPAPPDKRHTYVFKAYALEVDLGDLKEGYSKQELEDAMEGFIVAEAKLTGTYAP